MIAVLAVAVLFGVLEGGHIIGRRGIVLGNLPSVLDALYVLHELFKSNIAHIHPVQPLR